jgi:hypothetical protein
MGTVSQAYMTLVRNLQISRMLQDLLFSAHYYKILQSQAYTLQNNRKTGDTLQIFVHLPSVIKAKGFWPLSCLVTTTPHRPKNTVPQHFSSSPHLRSLSCDSFHRWHYCYHQDGPQTLMSNPHLCSKSGPNTPLPETSQLGLSGATGPSKSLPWTTESWPSTSESSGSPCLCPLPHPKPQLTS